MLVRGQQAPSRGQQAKSILMEPDARHELIRGLKTGRHSGQHLEQNKTQPGGSRLGVSGENYIGRIDVSMTQPYQWRSQGGFGEHAS